MKLPIKKGWAIAIGVVLLLWILNPGISSFRDYIGDRHYYDKYVTRKANFLVFSIYEDYDGNEYASFLLNFIKLSEARVSSAYQYSPDSTSVDSTKMMSDDKDEPIDSTKKTPSFNEVMGNTAGPGYKNKKHDEKVSVDKLLEGLPPKSTEKEDPIVKALGLKRKND